MSCQYCEKYEQSKHREGSFRFCPSVQRMVNSDGKMCDKISICSFFWCKKEGCWMNFYQCSGRQNRKEDGCNHCHQKNEILETRRFAGRVANKPVVSKPKKTILIIRSCTNV